MSEVKKATVKLLRLFLGSLCCSIMFTSIFTASASPLDQAQTVQSPDESMQVLQSPVDGEAVMAESERFRASIPADLSQHATTGPVVTDVQNGDEVEISRNSGHQTADVISSDYDPSRGKPPPSLENEELTSVILGASFLVIVIIPCFPFWILSGLAHSETEVAFANDMEIFAYFIGWLSLVGGSLFLLSAQSIVFLSLAMLLIGFSLIVFFSLLGFQRQLSRNLLTTLLMFITKIAYFFLTFLIATVLRLLALLFAKNSYDKAKNHEYASAGLMLGGAAVSWRTGGKLLTNMSRYANGAQIPAVAKAFPGDSFFGLIKQGLQGYSSRYAYQKRWKTI